MRYFNHKYQRTGTLWEGRYRSCLVGAEDYLFEVYRYIELNPVRVGMVNVPVNIIGQVTESMHWGLIHNCVHRMSNIYC